MEYKKKVNKVKVAKKEMKKVTKVEEKNEKDEMPKFLNDLLSLFKDFAKKEEEELKLLKGEGNNYYVVFIGEREGKVFCGSTSLFTNLNIFQYKGKGFELLAKKLEESKDIDNVTVINVVKLDKSPEDIEEE